MPLNKVYGFCMYVFRNPFKSFEIVKYNYTIFETVHFSKLNTNSMYLVCSADYFSPMIKYIQDLKHEFLIAQNC